MKLPKCMFCQPNELSGIGKVCLVFKSVCNSLDERCVAFQKHTAESRQALMKAIETVKQRRNNEPSNS